MRVELHWSKGRTCLKGAFPSLLKRHGPVKANFLLLHKAKAAGYKLNLVYVGIDDADQSNSLVLTRVTRGGYDVPESDIFQRYNRSLENLPKAMQLCDRVRILDNVGADYRYVLSIDHHKVKFVSKQPPQWLRNSVAPSLLKRNDITRLCCEN